MKTAITTKLTFAAVALSVAMLSGCAASPSTKCENLQPATPTPMSNTNPGQVSQSKTSGTPVGAMPQSTGTPVGAMPQHGC